MSEYIAKSFTNSESGKLLFDNEKYSSSIHCVYYSTYQLLLYIINYKLKNEWDSFQERKYAESLNNKNSKEESHNLTISFIKENIINTNEVFGRLFHQQIGILKRHRHNADYKENVIDPRTATISLGLSNTINEKLINHFELL
jgi:uncharacterized protein (UPF0332 family)